MGAWRPAGLVSPVAMRYMITIRQAWKQGRLLLRHSPTPDLDARLLLESVLQREHSYLVAHDDEPLTDLQLARYQNLLSGASRRTPIPYLIGQAPFFGLMFEVTPAVLIPRPETEQLVEHAVAFGRRYDHLRVVDVGVGSGCIAVTMARQLPQAEVVGVDISAAALAVAARNIARHVPGRVRLVQGDLLSALVGPFDLITANLPYVAESEWTMLDDGVKSFEPRIALYGGSEGLDLFKVLLPQAAERLAPGGMILLEIGWRQGEAVSRLAREHFPGAMVRVLPDLAGLDRIVAVGAPGSEMLPAAGSERRTHE